MLVQVAISIWDTLSVALGLGRMHLLFDIKNFLRGYTISKK